MTCYETICTIIQVLGFLVLAFMVYSIKVKERAEEYHHWQHFGFKYGCRSPEEMRVLIDDLVRKINELEAR